MTWRYRVRVDEVISERLKMRNYKRGDHHIINFQVQKPSRKRLKAGDIFVMKILDKGYLFGRVIRVDALGSKMVFGEPGTGKMNVVYIYKGLQESKEPIPDLRKEDLLIPPMVTNRLAWSRGYFETVESRELEDGDLFYPHCFAATKRSTKFYDEYGNRLDREYPPTGQSGLTGYAGIDAQVSKALGLPIRWEDSEPEKPSAPKK